MCEGEKEGARKKRELDRQRDGGQTQRWGGWDQMKGKLTTGNAKIRMQY